MRTTEHNATAIDGLDPAAVWKIFASLSSVPRPSKNEERVQQWALDLAEEYGLSAHRDDVGNIVIRVPASKGCEKAPIVVLQGHLDMVTEKNSGTEHDFDKDPIQLVRDADKEGRPIIRAEGTTLGADNGVGVSLALAAATVSDTTHGPLEILLTCDEETGMTGAKALVPESIRGRILLNLDSEEDNALYIGCAGGGDVTLNWNFPLLPANGEYVAGTVSVEGCMGGHSGCDIHLNRGNAIQVLARTIVLGDPEGRASLTTVKGGSQRNAIPREAHAELFAPKDTWKTIEAAAHSMQHATRRNEPNVEIRVKTATRSSPTCASKEDTRLFLKTLVGMPSGVLALVPEIPGLVQTSNNLSTAHCERKPDTLQIQVGCLSRSSVNEEIDRTMKQVGAIGSLGGAEVKFGENYPGWTPEPASPLLATCREIFENVMGEPAQILSIHAGLECGIIGDRVGKIAMISFGPNILGAHSPDERVHIESVAKIWRYLGSVLSTLAKN